MLCEACKGTGLKSDLALCDVCDGSGGQPQPADRDPDPIPVVAEAPKPEPVAQAEAPSGPAAAATPDVSPLANPEVQVTPITVTPEVPPVPPVIGASETAATPAETVVASTEGTAS